MKKTILVALVTIGLLSPLAVVGGPVSYAAVCSGSAADCAKTGVGATSDGTEVSVDQAAKTIVNVLLFIIGVVSVIMIVIGGLKYVTSNGNSNQVEGAKNTILYAVMGLVVAIAAYAIVNLVVDAFV